MALESKEWDEHEAPDFWYISIAEFECWGFFNEMVPSVFAVLL